VWEATVDGRSLHFHLAGINNQNFIMRDEETGSWWQQVTGAAIFGPLKGHQLKPVAHDELSFAIWKQEQPQGRVLRPEARILEAKGYPPVDWENHMDRVPVVSRAAADDPLASRNLIVGITVEGMTRAYPLSAIQKQSPVIDMIGRAPILIVVGDDNRSVRAYDRTVDGRPLEFFKKGASPLQLVDAETGSTWDFTGQATGGQLQGRQLQKINVLEDYWFDWKTYNPGSSVYLIGER
jgi:hypothetical protein